MSRNDRPWLVFWSTPALGVLVGIVYLAAASFRGHPLLGLVMFAVMLVFSATVVLISRRSETVRGLLDRQDERIAGIDLRATATAGVALTLVIVGGGVVELARGHSGAPYTWLAAVAAAAYVGAVLVMRMKG
jgi:uncharacterized membrane protein YfcA